MRTFLIAILVLALTVTTAAQDDENQREPFTADTVADIQALNDPISMIVGGQRPITTNADTIAQVTDFSLDLYDVSDITAEPTSIEDTFADAGAVALSDTLLAVAANRIVQVYALDTGEPTLSVEGAPDYLHINADSSRLIGLSFGGALWIWSLENGDLLAQQSGGLDGGRYAIAPDTSQIAVYAGSEDYTVRIYDTGSGDLLDTIESLDYAVQAMTYGPDALYIADTDALYQYDGEMMQTVRDGFLAIVNTVTTDQITGMALYNDTAAIMTQGSVLHLVDTVSGEITATAEDLFGLVGFSPDGSLVAAYRGTFSVRDVVFLETSSGEELGVAGRIAYPPVVFGPDWTYMVTNDLQMWGIPE